MGKTIYVQEITTKMSIWYPIVPTNFKILWEHTSFKTSLQNDQINQFLSYLYKRQQPRHYPWEEDFFVERPQMGERVEQSAANDNKLE